MSRPFEHGLTLGSNNPEHDREDSSLFLPNEIEPSSYQLSQNYFTLGQLLGQEGYQVVRGKDWVYFGGMEDGNRHGMGVLITKNTVY
jgi:hypothetical protein